MEEAKKIEKEICEKSGKIANAISRGNDVEIIRTSYGITIKEISKKKIS